MKPTYLMAVAAIAMSVTTVSPVQAQCYGCGGLVGGLAGGIIGGAIAGSIAANAQPRPVYVIQQRRVVHVKRAPRQRVAQPRAGEGGAQKAAINTSADPFAKSGSSSSAEPTPVSAKQ